MFVFLLGSAIAVATVAAPAVPATQARTARTLPSDFEIRELAQSFVDSGMAKGIVVGVIDPDGKRRTFLIGDAGAGAPPLSERSQFEIGSINKTFTGTILADMVRSGDVRLDDPIDRYLPAGVKAPSFAGKPITLLHLATHTSGLPRLPTGYVPPDATNPYAAFQAADLHAFLNRYELTRAPGEKMEYSNLGAGLLGYLLTRAARARDFPSLVEQRILKPLGMRQTGYGRPPQRLRLFTKGHDQQGSIVPYWDVGVLAGAGGLNSDLNDMLEYADANLGPPSLPIERAMRDAHRGHVPGNRPEVALGLGWMSVTRGGRVSLGHAGGTAGYSTYIGLDPELGAGTVVLTNTGNFEYADFIGRKILEPGWRTSVALPVAELADYVGTYRLRSDFEVAVTLDKGRLWAQATGQGRQPLFAAARDCLFLRTVDAELIFSRDSSGKVTGMTLNQNGKQSTGPKLD